MTFRQCLAPRPQHFDVPKKKPPYVVFSSLTSRDPYARFGGLRSIEERSQWSQTIPMFYRDYDSPQSRDLLLVLI
jgi:hypothetical protein